MATRDTCPVPPTFPGEQRRYGIWQGAASRAHRYSDPAILRSSLLDSAPAMDATAFKVRADEAFRAARQAHNDGRPRTCILYLYSASQPTRWPETSLARQHVLETSAWNIPISNITARLYNCKESRCPSRSSLKTLQ